MTINDIVISLDRESHTADDCSAPGRFSSLLSTFLCIHFPPQKKKKLMMYTYKLYMHMHTNVSFVERTINYYYY